MSIVDAYTQIFHVCGQWATSPESQPLSTLQQALSQFPPIPFDPEAYAVVLSQHCDLTSTMKTQHFRNFIYEYLTTANTLSVFQPPGDELWHLKDSGQLLCEMVLLRDLQHLQREFLIVVMSGVIVYGNDACTVVAFLISLRALWGQGRSGNQEETAWIVNIIPSAIARAKEYVVSDQFGEVPLAALLQGLI